MKNKKFLTVLIIVFILVALSLILAARFIPIASKPTGCGEEQRFSLLLGQGAEYKSKQTRIQGINEGVCNAYGDYSLYVI